MKRTIQLLMMLLVMTFTGALKASAQEAYAVLSDNNTKLTFYYDGNRSNYATTYGMNTVYYIPGWYESQGSPVTSVVFDPSFADARPTSCHCWFYKMSYLKSITGIQYLNTSEVTDMGYMFYNCSDLTSLDVSGFNTGKVTCMNHMFYGCYGLSSLDLSNFDTSKVDRMDDMFHGCYGLRSVNVSGFDTKKVTNMCCMFINCYRLTSIDVSGFNTANVTDMSGMFDGCTSLKSVDVSGFNTDKVTDIGGMFFDCSSLTSLDLSGFTLNSNINTVELLKGCSSLKTLTIPSITEDFGSDAFTGVGTTSAPCTLIYPINLSIDDYVTAGSGYIQWLGGYFKENKKPYAMLTDNNTKLTFYYDTSWRSRSGTVCLLNIESRAAGWYANRATITSVVFNSSFINARPPSCYWWFGGMTNLTSISCLGYLNTKNVTNMKSMFNGCSGLTSLNVSEFNTDNVTDMSSMFYNCSGLTSLDVSKFNTAKVTDMFNMFGNCSGLTSLDVSGFNTAKVTSMQQMFLNCSGLTSLDLSGFTFKSNTVTTSMLKSCSGLQTLSIPSSASLLPSTACSSIGTQTAPCTLIYPDSFTPEVTSSGTGWYQWKGGYFKDVEPEAYAVLSADETTLTFYYDYNRDNYTTTYNLNTGTNDPEWFTYESPVTSVVFDASFADARPTSCYDWFCEMPNLTSITGIGYLNTSEVTNMEGMFAGCTSLTSLDLSGFNTANVTSMDGMFAFCGSLTSLDLSGFTTTNVTDMTNMFVSCSSLTSLDVSGFNTANVTSMYQMFASCSKLTSLDLSGFNTANVTNMEWMFADCYTLTSLDVSGFNTANVTSMYRMFAGCSSLTSLNVSGVNTEKVTNMNEMFQNCSSLTSLDVSSFNTARVRNMDCMFEDCSSLTSLNLSNFTFNHGEEDEGYSTSYLLHNCSALKTLSIPSTAGNLSETACENVGTTAAPCSLVYPDSFTPQVTSTGSGWFQWKSGYFKEAPKAYAVLSSDEKTLTFYYDTGWSSPSSSGTVYNLNTGTNAPGWYGKRASITGVVFDSSFADAQPTSCFYWFRNMNNLTSITGIENLKTDEVTSMQSMFADCSSLTSLDVSGFNTDKVTTMQSMFADCYTLTSLDVSGFNTDKVTTMQSMFENCSNLRSLDVSRFNTEKVTNMSNMFKWCCYLTSLDVSGFNTARVTDMNEMFDNCSRLTSLDLSNFTFSNDIYTDYFLNYCIGLQTLAIPATADNFAETACMDVGTQSAPCALVYPIGFTPQATSTGSGWFQWKEGYFKDAPKAYAVLSTDYTTLTFYYDTSWSSRNSDGTLYPMNTGNNLPGWYGKRASITGVVFDSSFADARPTSCYWWFGGMSNLTSITGIAYLKTDNVTNMNYMFSNCFGLTSLDVSGFNTTNVTSMNAMFYGCSELTSLDLSGFTFNSSTQTAQMLNNCSGLETLTIPNTANYLNNDACIGVGSETAPCTLIYPEGFPLDVTSTGSGWYMWKSGYFKGETETYVLLSPDNTTLTFYCDGIKSMREGTVFELNTGTSNPGWYNNRTTITNVEFDPLFVNARPTSCYRWFYNMANLTSITGIEYLKTDNVTNMFCMFYGCSGLTTLDVSGFNTANVTIMNYMFDNCSGLTALDVSGFDTGNVTDMRYMFAGCKGLTSLDVSRFNTAKVTDMSEMFYGCNKLTSLDVSGFNTGKVTDMSGMFNGCSSLTTLDVSGFNTANVTRTISMFNGCSSLTTLDVSGFNTGKVTDMSGMFNGCSSLASLNVSGFNTAKVTQMPNMFQECSSLTSLDLSGFDTGNVTDMIRMFNGCSSLTTLDLSGFNTENVTFMAIMFQGCSSLTSLDVSGFDTDNVMSMMSMFEGCSGLTSLDVSGFDTRNVTSMMYMFRDCSGLTSLDVSGFNTTKVTNMNYMFRDCSGLTSLDLSRFTFNSSTQTAQMLNNCSGLETLTIPNTANYLNNNACTGVGSDTAPCTLIYPADMPLDREDYDSYFIWKKGYFKELPPETYCLLSPDNTTQSPTLSFYHDGMKSLREGLVYNLNTGVTLPDWFSDRRSITNVVFDSSFVNARPTSCFRWFYGMTNLTSVTGIENLKTDSVTNMDAMFYECSGLTSLDVSGFNTENVTTMMSMFYECSGLTSLDVSGFNTDNVTNMMSMFYNCSSLTSLDVSGFNTTKVTNMNYMFRDCSGLTSLDLSGFTFNSSTQTTKMLNNCNGLETLTIPNTANYLNYDACTEVGSDTAPCTLIYPADMPLDKEDYDSYFIWKKGYFKEAFVPGDANGDGTVSVADVMMTVDYVLGLNPAGFKFANANVVEDNAISVTDVMAIVDIVLGIATNNAPAQARNSVTDGIGLSVASGQCTVVLDNSEPFTALEFTIVMPEDAQLGNVAMMQARSNGHQVRAKAVAPGRYNMVVFAPSGTPLRDGTTALLHFDYSGCQPGDIAIEGTQLVNSQYETVLPTGVVTTITGIEADGAADGQMYYNTVGIGVKKPTRGVYITNGSKIVVK